MQSEKLNRRGFLQKASASAAGVSLAASVTLAASPAPKRSKETLAILGGKKTRAEPFTSWPMIEKNDIEAWNKVLEERKWCRPCSWNMG